jgi:signal transduction histidine kinase
MRSLADTAAAGWPLLATAALAFAGERLRVGRRRSALNRGLHELRRPLQALALTAPRASAGPGPIELAIAALADLDREINGGEAPPRLGEFAPRPLVAAAAQRWKARAAMIGGTIEFRWHAGPVLLLADPTRLAQALDNLIVNALEHGGPHITVSGSVGSGRLRIAIVDDGSDARRPHGEGPGAVLARLLGRRRTGHGLEVVREVAASHGGRFALQRGATGSVAMLELPLLAEGSLAA